MRSIVSGNFGSGREGREKSGHCEFDFAGNALKERCEKVDDFLFDSAWRAGLAYVQTA